MVKLQGNCALITGASKGIGRAIALAFAAEGADLAVTGRNEDELRSLAAAAEAQGVRCVVIAADLAERGAALHVFDEATAGLGSIQILVNNAGVGSSANPKPVVNYDDDFWEMMMYVNLSVPYLLSKAVLPDMLAAKYGRIINIASINGKIAALHGAAYAASKHGLLGLTRTLAMETAKEGITVNAIAPTVFRSALTAWMYEDTEKAKDVRKGFLSRVPKGRLGEPSDLAGPLLFLASAASDFYTGHILYADGGYTAG